MARTSPQTLAALAAAARQVIDVLASRGPVEPAVGDALDRIAKVARGEAPASSVRGVDRAIDRLAEARRKWTSPAEKDYFWAVGAVATLAGMAATGADHSKLVLDHLSYGLAGGEDPALRLTGWYRAARAAAAQLPARAAPAPRREVPAAETAALARMAKALGKHGGLLAKAGARVKPRRAGTPARLRALLKKLRYPAHASVLAFDAVFGGLLIPEDGTAGDWFETDEAIHVGAYACLASRAHTDPRGGREGLVPIAYTPSDGIVFLDRAGVAYFEDTIGDDRAGRFAASGVAAVTKLLRASRS